MNRKEFKQAVFLRDVVCVNCGATPQDAHHIIERRLWGEAENYGYFLANGVALCGPCHLLAESTELSCSTLRRKAKINSVVLPEHLYKDQEYDKWGNLVLPNGRRLPGELFYNESVQKIIIPVLNLFEKRVKYPRTYHLPWSPGVIKDDRVLPLSVIDSWQGLEVIVTEKRDGENTTLYNDSLHARSLDYEAHISRSRIKAFHASICSSLPENFRICGENLTAKHSIHYTHCKFFEVFSIWENLTCLSWDNTVEYAELLGLPMVPIIWRGQWHNNFKNPKQFHKAIGFLEVTPGVEGYVIRPADSFSYGAFRLKVGKYVRASHIQTQGHWMRQKVEFNDFE